MAGTTYDIFVVNNCGGVGFVKQVTVPSSSVYSGSFLVDSIIYNICGDTPVTLYSSTPFGTGTRMYFDAGLTSPVSGYYFIVKVGDGNIYLISNTTGIVGVPTGNVCAAGTAGLYILGNSTSTICSNGSVMKYTSGAFSIGSILYSDSGLTTPVTGYSYVVNVSNNHIYNLNPVTGAIISDTGLLCSSSTVIITSTAVGTTITSVGGISGYTLSAPVPVGGRATGTHNTFTGVISVGFTGTPSFASNATLYVNGIVIQCVNLPMTSGGFIAFTNATYNMTDVISIAFNTGSC